MATIVDIDKTGPDFRRGSADVFGEFWTKFFEDRGFSAGLTRNYAFDLERVRASFLELVSSIGRTSAPDASRTAVSPVQFKMADRSLGGAVRIKSGMDVSVGAQPESSKYPAGKVYRVGGHAVPEGYVAYPAPEGLVGVSSVTSSLDDPSVILVSGSDFLVRDETFLIREDMDPLGKLSGEFSGESDKLAWLVDPEFASSNYQDAFGCLVDVGPLDGPRARRAADALLDLRSGGSSDNVLRPALAALFDTAVVSEDSRVLDIVEDKAGFRRVLTGKEILVVRPNETIPDNIKAGARLRAGDYVTETIKFFKKLDTNGFLAANGVGLDKFAESVPKLRLGPGIIGEYGGSGGFLVSWAETDITCHGRTSVGARKLKFGLQGDDADVDMYFNWLWDRLDKRGESLDGYLSDHINETGDVADGTVVGRMSVLKFFMNNALKANASVLVVDLDAMSSGTSGLRVVGQLAELLPGHTMVFTLAKRSVDDDGVDVGSVYDTVTRGAAVTVTDDEVPAPSTGVSQKGVFI